MLKFVNSFLKKTLVLSLLFGYTVLNAKTTRDLYVISDLHMGIGKVDDNNKEWKDRDWDNLEDFRWHDEFDVFIHQLMKESKNTDLVIAGDFLELWQGKDDLCNYPDEKNYACSEKEALVRVKRVTKEHKQVFNSLNTFITKKGNKLIILPGNHDAALLLPSVAKHILKQFIKTHRNNVEISKTGYWLNEDGKIVVDHGHQVEFEVNRFDNWPDPSYKNSVFLQKTVGEQLVQKIFNELENDIPIIDNLSSEGEGFKYAFNDGWQYIKKFEFKKAKESRWKNIKKTLSSGIGVLFKHMSWDQLKNGLGEKGTQEINITAIRKNEGTTFFYKSLESNSSLYTDVKKLVEEENSTVPDIETLDDETIKKICLYRYQLNKDQNKSNVISTISECNASIESTSLGSVTHSINPFAEDEEEVRAEYIKKLSTILRRSGKTKGIEIYIYGHTHKAEDNTTYSTKDKEFEFIVLNSGAWQRVATVERLKQIAKDQGVKDIFDLKLEDLPACYTYVSAKVYEKPQNMKVELKYWPKGCKDLK